MKSTVKLVNKVGRPITIAGPQPGVEPIVVTELGAAITLELSRDSAIVATIPPDAEVAALLKVINRGEHPITATNEAQGRIGISPGCAAFIEVNQNHQTFIELDNPETSIDAEALATPASQPEQTNSSQGETREDSPLLA